MPKVVLTAAAKVLFKGTNCFTSARVAVFNSAARPGEKVADSCEQIFGFLLIKLAQ
jgi:hypothetical protein